LASLLHEIRREFIKALKKILPWVVKGNQVESIPQPFDINFVIIDFVTSGIRIA
jgi:hypothetical protein